MTSSGSFQPIDSSSIRDKIEEQVRNAILSGSLRPGEHLVESNIAEQLGVSRAPVREALSALEREGIISYLPRRGYFVIEFIPKDIEEIYSLRLLLEIGALRRTIQRITTSDIEELQFVVDALGEAVRHGSDQNEIASLDLSFHDLIVRKADHDRLHSAWKNLRLQTWLLIGLTSKTKYDYLEQPKEFHQTILDAIQGKDLERAETVLREHILDAQARAQDALKAYGEETEAV